MTHFALDARTATPHFPGIGRYVSNLARALAPLLAPNEMLTVIHDPDHPIEMLSSSAVRAIVLPTSPFSISQQWDVPQLLHRLRADLYHSPYIVMPYLPGVPALLTVYDLIPLRHPTHSTLRARLFSRGMTRLALRAARHVIAISEFTRRDFMAEFGLPPDRITAVPLAVNPAFHPQTPEAIGESRARYGIPERFALYLGSNKPHKNLGRLVEAWQIVNKTADRTALVIAGAWDPRYPAARQLATDTDSVHWLGPLPEADLPALYAAARVFVFPSLYEGFGLPVLEAMACGTPVICSNTSSLPEVAGDAALLVDPHDTAKLAETLRRVVSDDNLRAEMQRRGLAQAARFTWTRTAAATLALYRKISP